MKLVKILLVAVLLVVLVAVGALWIAGGGDGVWRHETSVTIDRPPAQVFPFLTEPALLKTWMGGLVETTPLSEGGVRVGARSREVIEVDGRRTEMESEITELAADAVLAVHIESESFAADVRYLIEDRGDSTQLTYSCETRFEGLAFKLLEPLIGAVAERKLAEDLAALKREVEQTTPSVREGVDVPDPRRSGER